PVELVRVAAGGDALERHAHPAGGPGPDKGAGAAVLRPADGRGHARRRARDRRVLRVPALLPARRDRGGAQGMTDTESSAPAAGVGPAGALPARRLAGGSRPSVGFDLDGVLIRNPFETCVVPRLAALLKATPGLKDLGEHEATRAVRQRVSGGWQRRMGAGDLVGAYDWDAIYREVAVELGGEPELAGGIDVARWVRECCGEDGHIAALPGAREALEGLAELGARLVVVTNG